MKKIIVTTDFSEKSKKGILFAMQLASQTDCELIFYNVVQIFMPSIWDNVYYGQFENEELKRSQMQLEQFVKAIYSKNKFAKQSFRCVCEVGISAGNQIIEYAKNQKASYICVSNIGGGSLDQLFGTTASELIAYSAIPVLIVPKNYRLKSIKTLFFASDFKNFNDELKHIENFATPLKAKTLIFHYDYKWFLNANKAKFKHISQKHQSETVTFNLRKLDSGAPLLDHVENDVVKTKPSIVVVFTKQNRNWFSRLFFSSLATELAIDTKTPLLIFKKHE